jgi:hypothetical protein
MEGAYKVLPGDEVTQKSGQGPPLFRSPKQRRQRGSVAQCGEVVSIEAAWDPSVFPLAVEHAQRRTERLAKKYPVPAGPGLPVQEGMTPVESMVAAGGVVSLQGEFGGRPKPRFSKNRSRRRARSCREEAAGDGTGAGATQRKPEREAGRQNMNPANNRVFWETPVNPRPLEVGTMLKVELYQAVADLSGHYGELRPHVVGQAEVVKDGTLKLSLSTISAAGREAAALLEDGVVDVVLWGSQPVIRLTQA